MDNKKLVKSHSHIAIVVRPPGRKTLCRSLVICKGFFRSATPAVIWQVFQFCKEIWFGLWSCYLRMAFLDGDNFCKAFAGAQVNLSDHEWRSWKIAKTSHWFLRLNYLRKNNICYQNCWKNKGEMTSFDFLEEKNSLLGYFLWQIPLIMYSEYLPIKKYLVIFIVTLACWLIYFRESKGHVFPRLQFCFSYFKASSLKTKLIAPVFYT